MTKEKKIEAIYKEMANKEKTFGCKYIVDDGEERFIARETEGEELALGEDANTFVRGNDLAGEITRIHLIEIIGHPVMIGDVLSYFERKDRIMTSVGEFEGTIENPTSIKEEYHIRDKIAKILYLYTSKTEPIEKQPNECIDYVYNLIQKD